MEITDVILGDAMFNYIGSPNTTPERVRNFSSTTQTATSTKNNNKRRKEAGELNDFEFIIRNSKHW